MIKKVIDFNRLPQKAYQKPAIEVCGSELEEQLLATSIQGVQSSGLDDDGFEYDSEGGDQGYAW